MANMILYGHEESGHSYKVALALALGAIEHEFRWVNVHAPREDRRPDFREVSRFGEIPVLVDDGVALAQSNAILLHLAERHRILGGETKERLAQSREWLFWEANRIGFSLANLRATIRYEPVHDHDPGALAWLRRRFQNDAERLDAELSKKAFLVGDAVSVADVSCSAYLFFAHEAGVEPSTWPNIRRWMDRIRALPGFAAPAELMRRP